MQLKQLCTQLLIHVLVEVFKYFPSVHSMQTPLRHFKHPAWQDTHCVWSNENPNPIIQDKQFVELQVGQLDGHTWQVVVLVTYVKDRQVSHEVESLHF
jgi:hypothetical protein